MSWSFQEIIEDFGRFIGIDSLTLDEQGLCILSIDTTTVYISSLEPTGDFLISAIIGRLDIPLSVPVAATLLSANAQVQLTDGAALGVTDDGTVTISRMLPVKGCDAHQFERVLERFVNSAETWRNSLNTIEQALRHDKPVDAEAGSDPWIRI